MDSNFVDTAPSESMEKRYCHLEVLKKWIIENQEGQKGTPEMKLACPTVVLSAFGQWAGVISTPAILRYHPLIIITAWVSS